MVTKADLVQQPGTTYLYSNLGYFLLGQVVESVSGKTLHQFAAEEIFGPLEMAATRFNDNVNQVVINRADGYRKMPDGSWVGFTARYNRFPQLDMSVVIFCNSLSRSAYKFGGRVGELAVLAVKD